MTIQEQGTAQAELPGCRILQAELQNVLQGTYRFRAGHWQNFKLQNYL